MTQKQVTKLPLPPPPEDVGRMTDVQAASVLGEWLFVVAQACGEPAVDRATGAEWPGSPEQRALLSEAMVDKARNEARQLASWPDYQVRIAAGTWGI